MKPEFLAAILKRIGNLSIRTFNDRLKLQKSIYFLQEFGIYLGYNFGWYLYGPYSPQLTKDAFDSVENTIHKEVKFVELEDEEKFRTFLSFLGERKDDADWLELLASIHFLHKIYNKSKNETFQLVKKKQPSLDNEKDFEEAWNYLKKFGLLR